VFEKDRSFKKRKVDTTQEKEGDETGWITVRKGENEGDDAVPVVEDLASKFTGGLVSAAEIKDVARKGMARESPPPEE